MLDPVCVINFCIIIIIIIIITNTLTDYLKVSELLHAGWTGERRSIRCISFVGFNFTPHVMKLVLDDIDKDRVADEVVIVSGRPSRLRVRLHSHSCMHKLHTHIYMYNSLTSSSSSSSSSVAA